MINKDTGNLFPCQPGTVTNLLGIRLGDGLTGDSRIASDSMGAVGTGQDNVDPLNGDHLLSLREQLEKQPHFRGRTSLIELELVEGTVVLSGHLPTHYLKQLLQEAVKLMPGVVAIDNRVLVMRLSQ